MANNSAPNEENSPHNLPQRAQRTKKKNFCLTLVQFTTHYFSHYLRCLRDLCGLCGKNFVNSFAPLLVLIAIACLTSSCANRSRMAVEEAPILTSISFVSRDGVTETISTEERLQQYAAADFLEKQPYEKVMRIHARDTRGDLKAYLHSYHPNGAPRQYLEVVNSRAHGVYKEWHENGLLKIEGIVIGGEADLSLKAQETWLFEGCCQVWDDAGHMNAKIPYEHGKLEGKAIYFHRSGTVWKNIACHQGLAEGLQEVFLEDGTLFQTVTYLKGERHGPATRYWHPNQIAYKEDYCQDKLMAGEYYTCSGELICKIENGNGTRAIFGKETMNELHEYHLGEQEGLVQLFNEKGVLATSHHIKHDEKNGEEIDYYPLEETGGKLTPQLSIQWVNGRVQGLVKTWYPSGAPESQREMSGNQKNGILTAWYRDGSVMLIEEYERNKLREGQYFMQEEKNPITEIHAGRGTATLFDSNGNFLRKVQYSSGKPVES